jgi:cytochrome c-type biogenesis protein CcmH/NrfG
MPAVDPEAGLKRALKAIADSDFDSAYKLLSEVRKERPSCPDTLAGLGWTAWRTENLGTNAYDGPEDFLLLALTFDAGHPRALEYYARIAIEKGEKENARNRLLQVLKVTPESLWAQDALDELNPKRKGKSGMRLWPKG